MKYQYIDRPGRGQRKPGGIQAIGSQFAFVFCTLPFAFILALLKLCPSILAFNRLAASGQTFCAKIRIPFRGEVDICLPKTSAGVSWKSPSPGMK
jgi:hypothetical protein